MSQPTIESILQEKRLFEPSAEFSQAAHIKSLAEYQQIYDRAKADPAAFWAGLAETELEWFEKWHTVLDWQPPSVKWFDGGKRKWMDVIGWDEQCLPTPILQRDTFGLIKHSSKIKTL